MTQAPLRHFFYRHHSCQDKQEPLQHPSRPTKPGWPGWHFGLTSIWDDGYFSLSAGPLSLKLEKKPTQLSGSCIFWSRGFFGLLCNLPRINIILKLVTKTHSQSWLRTEGECLHARAENPVGRKQYQLSVNIVNPVQTDRKRNTASQNLHKWHAGWQLHASCPRSWRCHWGIHGELQKREKKKAQMLNHVLKTAKSSVKLHSAKTPERSVGWQPYNNHPVGPMQQLFVPLMCQLSLTCPLPIRRLALLCNLLP